MLVFSGEKMSKSLGNVVTIDEFLEKYSADVLRFTVLNSGYRNPLTFNEEVLEQSERALERLRSGLRPALPGAKGAGEVNLKALEQQRSATLEGFTTAMDDDFNSSGGLAHIFELVRTINQARADGATDAELQPAQETLRELTGVLGLRLEEPDQGSREIDPFIQLLIELRRELRTAKQYQLADMVRQKLAGLGVMLEDSKEGTTWRWDKAA
jgi:cysteinyl-tRNA synthetase